MYVIESNVLQKYSVIVYPGGVYAYSPYPIKKELTVQVPSKCPESYSSEKCIYSSRVKLEISDSPRSGENEKKMSLGIILMMMVFVGILAWICYKKYNGLEAHARKLLENHRRNSYSANKFTL